MKYTRSRSLVVPLAISLLQIAVCGLARTELDTLLARLSDESLDRAVLLRLEGQPVNPRTIPSLRAAFEKKTAKRERQLVAATLLRLGDRSNQYFEFLANYAQQAIDDRTPFFERFDGEGQVIRGQFSSEFENWCLQNHKEPREVAAVQMGVYLEDVKILAETDDPRAIDLFHRGLESPNAGVIAYSVEGLGRLQDLTALPLISKAAARIPSGERTVIASQLAWYFHPEAEQLLARLIPEAIRREQLRRSVQMMKTAELNRLASRSGRSSLK